MLDIIILTNELIEPCMYAISGQVNNITKKAKCTEMCRRFLNSENSQIFLFNLTVLYLTTINNMHEFKMC